MVWVGRSVYILVHPAKTVFESKFISTVVREIFAVKILSRTSQTAKIKLAPCNSVAAVSRGERMKDIPRGLILDDEETPAFETETLLGAVTEPTHRGERRGNASGCLATVCECNGEGRKEPRHDGGHPCRGLPILTMKKATLRQVHGVSFCGNFYCYHNIRRY